MKTYQANSAQVEAAGRETLARLLQLIASATIDAPPTAAQMAANEARIDQLERDLAAMGHLYDNVLAKAKLYSKRIAAMEE